MAKYGIPYRGSKSKIADDILAVLPEGKRFVDLFGGGFAMSHCAMLSDMYEQVLYNDNNKQLTELIKDAIAGKYNYEVFKPEFVTREQFFTEKDGSAYIRWIWSFGNNGRDYIFGKNIEHYKHLLHDYVVFNKWDDELEPYTQGKRLSGADIKDRRLQWRNIIKENCAEMKRGSHYYDKDGKDIEQLQALQQLQQLQQLEITSMSYTDYKYQEGDVVYCDPPYKEVNKNNYYSCNFDYDAFLNWAANADYPVYFSSYDNLNDDRFEIIWQKTIRTTMASASNSIKVNECLYCNSKAERKK